MKKEKSADKERLAFLAADTPKMFLADLRKIAHCKRKARKKKSATSRSVDLR
ncbi:MAG TPA: hypothetical protein VHW02_15040 [Rhizomicrobium sp.]|jgi:hypothetical protein|nr:hypothetical protein [Rhizomicrobium sp.]